MTSREIELLAGVIHDLGIAVRNDTIEDKNFWIGEALQTIGDLLNHNTAK